MTRIRVKEPVVLEECFGDWSDWTSPSSEQVDGPWISYRQQRDYVLQAGEYDLERIPNPALRYEDREGAGPWLVLKGTEIGIGDWTPFIEGGKVEVIG